MTQHLLVPRDELVKELQDEYDDMLKARRGGRVVLVHGGAKVGKTALVEGLFAGPILFDHKSGKEKVHLLRVTCQDDATPVIRPILDMITTAPLTAEQIHHQPKSVSITLSRLSRKFGTVAQNLVIEYWPDTVSFLPFGNQIVTTAQLVIKVFDLFDQSRTKNILLKQVAKWIDAKFSKLAASGPVILLIDQAEKMQPSAWEFIADLIPTMQKYLVFGVFVLQNPDEKGRIPDQWKEFANKIGDCKKVFVAPLDLAKTGELVEYLLKQYYAMPEARQLSAQALSNTISQVYLQSHGRPGAIRTICERIFRSKDFDKITSVEEILEDNYKSLETADREVILHAAVQGPSFYDRVVTEIIPDAYKNHVPDGLERGHHYQLVEAIASANLLNTHQFSSEAVHQFCIEKMNPDYLKTVSKRTLKALENVYSNRGEHTMALPVLSRISAQAEDFFQENAYYLDVCETHNASYARIELKESAETGLRKFSEKASLAFPEDVHAWGKWTADILNAFKGQPEYDQLLEFLLYRARAAQLLEERISGEKQRANKQKSLAQKIYEAMGFREYKKAEDKEFWAHRVAALEPTQNIELRVKAYLMAGYFFYWEYWHSAVATATEAQYAFGEVEKLIAKLKDKKSKQYALALCGIGFSYNGRSIGKGFDFYADALSLSKEQGWNSIQATAEHGLGFIYLTDKKRQDKKLAKQHLEESLKLKGINVNTLDDEIPFDAGNTLATLADLAMEDGDLERAEKYALASAWAQRGDTSHILGPYLTLLRLYYSQNRPPEFRATFEEIRKILTDADELADLKFLRDFLKPAQNLDYVRKFSEEVDAMKTRGRKM